MARTKSNRRPDIEKYLDGKGVNWEYLENVPIGSFDIQKSLRNQARMNKLIPTQVETYVDAAQRGDVFPPVLASRDPGTNKLVVIDGNHRLEMANRLERSVDVYVCTAEPQIVTLMTFEANTRHGMPSSQEERVTHAIWLIDNGASQSEAAAAVSAPLNAVKKEWNRRKAERRAQDMGIPPQQWEGLHQSVRSRLLNINADESFKAATELCYQANLGVQEAFDLVSAVNETSSTTRQLGIIENLRKNEYGDRISGGAALFGPKQGRGRTPKSRFNSSLGMVLSAFPDDLSGLASMYAAPERDDAASRARDAAKKLEEFADTLEALNAS